MHISNAETLEAEAKRFVESLSPMKNATVVALSGDLGAGKTTFVQGVAKALGVEEHVTSPTFVIMKIYDLVGQRFGKLVHIDAYRLKGMRHLQVLGWDALLHDPGNLIFVEWPEKIAEAIPADALRLAFRYSNDETREIVYGEKNDTVE